MDRELLEKLLVLTVRANNIIMKGSFNGDDVHEASAVMQICAAWKKTAERDLKILETVKKEGSSE